MRGKSKIGFRKSKIEPSDNGGPNDLRNPHICTSAHYLSVALCVFSLSSVFKPKRRTLPLNLRSTTCNPVQSLQVYLVITIFAHLAGGEPNYFN
jgi:hypothetical protein